MKVLSAPGVEDLVKDHGGSLFVWTDPHRCCGGGITFLETDWTPRRGKEFERADVEGFELWFASGSRGLPEELHLEVKGLRRKRVEAYWDGCAFAI
jgi:hypothetical protein